MRGGWGQAFEQVCVHERERERGGRVCLNKCVCVSFVRAYHFTRFAVVKCCKLPILSIE